MDGKYLNGLGCALLVVGWACGVACADELPVNTWIAPGGGNWEDAANWSNPDLVTAKQPFYAVFTNASPSYTTPLTVTNTTEDTVVYGLRYQGAAPTWNYLRLVGADGRGDKILFSYKPHDDLGGCARLDVPAGSTVWLDGRVRQESGVLEKTGSGMLGFRSSLSSSISLRVANGFVEPFTYLALASADVSIGGEGRFRPQANCYVGTLSVRDVTDYRCVNLKGHTVAFGQRGNEQVYTVNVFTNAGTLVSQNGGRVTFGAEQEGTIDLTLRNGDMRFGVAKRGVYTFDDAANPWANAVGDFADLVVGKGTPTVVEDAERGRVLYLDGQSSLTGPGANGALDGMPLGDGDYTVAFWMKKDAACKANGGLLFWGKWAVNRQCTVLRVGQDKDGRAFMLAHYGMDMEVTAETAFTALDGSWHHVAIQRSNGGKTDAFYVDGVRVQTRGDSLPSDIQAGPFNLGWGQTGGFVGWIDDFTVVSAAVEPIALMGKLGTPSFRHAPIVRSEENGVLWHDGVQEVAGLAGDGMTGAVALDGELPLVGTGGATSFVWRAELVGTGTVVKTGADFRQVLEGPQSFTGALRVEAGELVVRPAVATQQVAGLVADWRFDDVQDPGRDSSGNGFALVSRNGARVVEDETRGRVLELDAAQGAYLVTAGTPYPVAFPSGAQAYTVSLWIKADAGRTVNDSVWFWGDVGDGGKGVRTAEYLRFNGQAGVMSSNWGNNTTLCQDVDFHDGTWHHLAKVYAGSSATLYVDGQPVQTWWCGNLDVHVGVDYPLYLGFRNNRDASAVPFGGRMDDMRIYSYALTAAEVAEEFAGVRHLDRTVPVDATGALEALPEPVARWTFEDAASPYTASGTVGAFTLTPVGDVAVTEDDQRPGRVLDLAGNTMRYLRAETVPEGLPTEGSFTVSFWMRPEGNGGAGSCFYYGSPDSAFHLVGYNGVGTFRYTTAVGGDTWMSFHAPYGGVAARKWTHVTAVYDADAKSRSVYYDGVRVGVSVGVTVPSVTPALFYLGRKQSSETEWFKGRLDDVAVWDRALTAEQVRQLCREELPRRDQPLVPPGTALAVSAGARLTLERGADVAAATLDGAGTVELAGAARLTLARGGTFDGTFEGAGSVVVAGGALRRSDGAAFAVPLALADGIVVETDAAGTDLPVADTAVALTLPAHGTLAFTCAAGAVPPGTFILARGNPLVAPDGLAGWTWRDATGQPTAGMVVRFAVKDNALVAHVLRSGTLLLVR